MSFRAQSSKSLQNVSTSNSSEHQMSVQLQQLYQTVNHCIANDLPLLKTNIDWSTLSHPMPNTIKDIKTDTISLGQLVSQMDQMSAKMDQLSPHINDGETTLTSKSDAYFKSLNDGCNRLKTSLPPFKQLVTTFSDKYENQLMNESVCFDRKIIELDEQKVDKVLQLSQQIHHLQQTNKHLNSMVDHK